jgi:predicted MPP superfamily phosphohydrolase
VREGFYRFYEKSVEVPLARLSTRFDGLKIVQLSDVHIGPTLGASFMRAVVEQTNALGPDIVAITGDLVDGSVENLGEAVSELRHLRATHGVYFVTGNHEYYSGADPWCRFLEGLGIVVLRNERVSIGEGDEGFDLVGIDDFQAGRFEGHGPDLPRALAGRDASRELILLAHQPKAVHEAQEPGVGLQLSGHTHGGQIWPFNWLVKLAQPAVQGLSWFEKTALYVSSGTGYWGPPMRLGTKAEVTEIVLRSGGPAKLAETLPVSLADERVSAAV